MKINIVVIILISTFFIPLNGKIVVLGNNSPEEQLVYPGKIVEGPDKNIYIYDRLDAFIKVFSPQGKMIRKIGGKGEGPGQVKRADGLDFGFTPDGDKLYFTEYFTGHKWITFTNLQGILKGTLKYKIKGFFGVTEARIQDSDTIYMQVERLGKTERIKDVYYSYYLSEIVVIDKSGNQTSSVLKKEHPERISFIKRGGDKAIPFTPGFMWAVTKNGNVIFTNGTGNELEVYNRAGKLKKRIIVPVPEPEKVTKEDIIQWRDSIKEIYKNKNKSWYKRFGSVIEKYTRSIFKFKPVILGMSLTPAGNILLTCRAKEKDKFKYVLTKINGKLITESVSKFHRIQISENYIFFVRISEDEESEISFIIRSGGEKGDLLKIFSVSH